MRQVDAGWRSRHRAGVRHTVAVKYRPGDLGLIDEMLQRLPHIELPEDGAGSRLIEVQRNVIEGPVYPRDDLIAGAGHAGYRSYITEGHIPIGEATSGQQGVEFGGVAGERHELQLVNPVLCIGPGEGRVPDKSRPAGGRREAGQVPWAVDDLPQRIRRVGGQVLVLRGQEVVHGSGAGSRKVVVADRTGCAGSIPALLWERH